MTAPWEGFLNISRLDSSIATGIQQAWSHLTNNCLEVAPTGPTIDTSKILIVQPVTRAGFYEDGSMAASITKAVTIELETQRSTRLGSVVISS